MCNSYDVDVARYNYMISPNAFCSQVFPSAFGINKERLIETGYPRNDFIVNATKDDVFRIKKKSKYFTKSFSRIGGFFFFNIK